VILCIFFLQKKKKTVRFNDETQYGRSCVAEQAITLSTKFVSRSAFARRVLPVVTGVFLRKLSASAPSVEWNENRAGYGDAIAATRRFSRQSFAKVFGFSERPVPKFHLTTCARYYRRRLKRYVCLERKNYEIDQTLKRYYAFKTGLVRARVWYDRGYYWRGSPRKVSSLTGKMIRSREENWSSNSYREKVDRVEWVARGYEFARLPHAYSWRLFCCKKTADGHAPCCWFHVGRTFVFVPTEPRAVTNNVGSGAPKIAETNADNRRWHPVSPFPGRPVNRRRSNVRTARSPRSFPVFVSLPPVPLRNSVMIVVSLLFERHERVIIARARETLHNFTTATRSPSNSVPVARANQRRN